MNKTQGRYIGGGELHGVSICYFGVSAAKGA